MISLSLFISEHLITYIPLGKKEMSKISEIKDDITCTPFGLYILIEKTEPSPPFMYRKVHSCMKYNESMSQNTHSL